MRKTICKCNHCKKVFHITEKDAKQKIVENYITYSCKCPFCNCDVELGNNQIMSLALNSFLNR